MTLTMTFSQDFTGDGTSRDFRLLFEDVGVSDYTAQVTLETTDFDASLAIAARNTANVNVRLSVVPPDGANFTLHATLTVET